MLRTGGRYVIGGLVNPNADVTLDANLLLRRWITLRGVAGAILRRRGVHVPYLAGGPLDLADGPWS